MGVADGSAAPISRGVLLVLSWKNTMSRPAKNVKVPC